MTDRVKMVLPDGRIVMVPTDRLNPWHTVKLEEDCWRMSHPLDCDLWDCKFNEVARAWTELPAPFGTYRWGPELSDWSFEVAP